MPEEPELLKKTRAITFMQGQPKADEFDEEEEVQYQVSYDLASS